MDYPVLIVVSVLGVVFFAVGLMSVFAGLFGDLYRIHTKYVVVGIVMNLFGCIILDGVNNQCSDVIEFRRCDK